MTASPQSFTKRVAFGLVLVGLIVVATLGFFELALHVAAFFVSPRALSVSEGDAAELILCLGDSNTYGVFYPEEQAYPAQLRPTRSSTAAGCTDWFAC